MKNKGISGHTIYMVVSVVVAVAIAWVLLSNLGQTSGIMNWFWIYVTGLLKNLLGIGLTEDNDLTRAIKCSYYRCAEGCVKTNQQKWENIDCPCKKNIQDVDGDGRVCNEEGEMFPVELKDFSGSFNTVSVSDFKIDNINFKCMVYPSSYSDSLAACNENCNWLYIVDEAISEVEEDFCKIKLLGIQKAVKSVTIEESDLYIRTHTFCAPGDGICKTPPATQGVIRKEYTTMIENTPRSIYVTRAPFRWSGEIEAERTWKRIVIKEGGEEHNEAIDWVLFISKGYPWSYSIEYRCSNGAGGILNLNPDTRENSEFICKDKFAVKQTSNDKINIIYANKITFYPSTVSQGDSVSAVITFDDSYIGKELQLNDRCPRIGLGGTDVTTFAECEVSRMGPLEPPVCTLQFTVTQDTTSTMELCDGGISTGYVGVLKITGIQLPACECNPTNTACESSNCQGCAKCGILRTSPVCYNGEWRSSTYEGYSTYGSCCDIDDCLENFEKCYNDGFGWRCLYGSPLECDNTMCQYNEVNCGNSQSECDTLCSPNGCGA